MKKYSDYTVEDFIHDDRFFQWVKSPVADADTFWKEFLLSHPEKAQTLADARQVLQSLAVDDQFSAAEKAALWHRIDAAAEAPVAPMRKAGIGKLGARLAVAASLLLLLGAGVVWYTLYRTVAIHTGVAQKKNIQLPDGSTVVLNSNSSLSYKVNWKKGLPREVWVTGEAFFQVNHLNKDTLHVQPGERFYVHASNIDIEVLGTTFNVYDRRGNTNVSLNSGKVQLHFAAQQDVVTMKPGEIVTYKKDKKSYKKQETNAEAYSAWSSSDKMVLNQTPLTEVFRLIEDTYGLKVETEGAFDRNEMLSGELPANDEQQMLKALEKTLQVTVVKVGNDKLKIISGK